MDRGGESDKVVVSCSNRGEKISGPLDKYSWLYVPSTAPSQVATAHRQPLTHQHPRTCDRVTEAQSGDYLNGLERLLQYVNTADKQNN